MHRRVFVRSGALALLALGEVLPPGTAYIAAAVASSLLIVLYSVTILRSYARAGSNGRPASAQRMRVPKVADPKQGCSREGRS